MWRFAHAQGFARELKALHRPRPVRAVAAALGDWALIAAATAGTVALGWAAVPVALLVIGNRQRALGNLLHDASHWSFDGDRRRSAILADLLFCWPLWVSMAIYRDEHNRHHRSLGDPARDPDYIHDPARLGRGWVAVWLDQIGSAQMFRRALFADLGRMDARTRLGVLGWWGAVLGLVSAAAGPKAALVFLALWIGARATAFHAITAFREISDHVGLVPGGVVGFSRNHPFGGLAGQLVHPHHNGYHLLHHLCPGIPFHAMPRAHALLLRWPDYAGGEHCHSYLCGPASAVRSWTSRWTAGAAAPESV